MADKIELNKMNLGLLFGRDKLTKEQQEMYDNIMEEGHETTPRDVAKYFPNKERMIKKIASPRDMMRKKRAKKMKAKRKVKGCGCK